VYDRYLKEINKGAAERAKKLKEEIEDMKKG
jgi:hypothetical protein